MCYHDSNFRYHSEIGIPINDLVESLGVTGILRFLEQFNHEEVVTISQKNTKIKKANL